MFMNVTQRCVHDAYDDEGYCTLHSLLIARQKLTALKEKARAAVKAPYEDILDMGLAQALRELKEEL